MEPMLIIPVDRKPLKVGRICLMLGLTVLLYMMLASRFGHAAEVLAAFAR